MPLARTCVLLHETEWGHAEVNAKDGVSLCDGEWARNSIGHEFGRDFIIDNVWELKSRGKVVGMNMCCSGGGFQIGEP